MPDGTGTPLPAYESRIRRCDMTRERRNRRPVCFADLVRQAPPSNGSSRLLRHHLAGGSHHSLSGADTTPTEQDVKPEAGGLCVTFSGHWRRLQESSRIPFFPLFSYEVHGSRRVEKMSTEPATGEVDSDAVIRLETGKARDFLCSRFRRQALNERPAQECVQMCRAKWRRVWQKSESQRTVP